MQVCYRSTTHFRESPLDNEVVYPLIGRLTKNFTQTETEFPEYTPAPPNIASHHIKSKGLGWVCQGRIQNFRKGVSPSRGQQSRAGGGLAF